MQLWKLTIAYDGTPFHGWQVQPGLPTVQGTLAEAIRHVTRETVLPQGSGRTDTGVHALGQVASFTLAAPIPPANLLRALNRALPPAVRVMTAEHAPVYSPEFPFHARHSALRKTYEYRVFQRVPHPLAENPASRLAYEQPDNICPPDLAPYVWDCPWHVDLTRANAVAAHVLGEHDFTSFAAADFDLNLRNSGEVPNPVRRILASGWHLRPGTGTPLLVYQVTGTGFLHHMVRNLVGTFVDAASGRLDPASVPEILTARDRRRAGQTAPASGLFLVSVVYPELLSASSDVRELTAAGHSA